MSTQTWHVSITLDDDGGGVTAHAALDDAMLDVVGTGVVPTVVEGATDDSLLTMAAVRSLESLSDALTYVAEAERFADADQA